MATSSTAHLHAAVAFKQVAGTLAAHANGTLSWTPSTTSSSVAAFTINYVDIAGLQTSKQGAEQTALMVALANGAQVAGKSKVLLIFNAEPQTALDNREAFKSELTTAIMNNRAAQQQPAASASASGSSTPLTAGFASSRPPSVPSSPAPAARRVATPDVASSSGLSSPGQSFAKRSDTASDPLMPLTDNKLRVSVLRSDKNLRNLHMDVVVIGGAMKDEDFWSHPQRQALIRAERARLEQRRGRNARLADPKPAHNEAGELKLNVSNELIADIFEQFPVVARAYEENVPSKLDQSAFWQRYFQSKLYHRLRTSARSAASEHIVQDDPVFDKYLEDEDDQLEPRRLRNPHDRLLDLAATEEDHQETGNTKDWTMRAGAERRTLPLMRRFNDHSQSLLDSALGEQEEAERRARRVVGGVGEEYDANDPTARENVEAIKARYYREIEIDDLNESERTERVRLNVSELDGYPQSQDRNQSVANGADEAAGEGVGRKRKRANEDDGSIPRTIEEVRATVERFDADIKGWMPQLGDYKPRKGESEVAMKVMLRNVRSRTTDRGVNDLKTLPATLQKTTTSIQASTTEFLRQLWSCLSPSSAPLGDAAENKATNWKDVQASNLSSSSSAAAGVDAEGVAGDAAREREKEERLERARKMVSSLEKSLDKMQNVQLEAEEEHGVDAARKVATAVEKALKIRIE
ncbi:related to TFB1 - subunit of RNA polymerase II transcription initiation factor TFIIH [Pseudozyma flocculosa]|uniref:Related to TFB1 - subunit of RNA polymerase II transcription initiation factor TFIIH n=1 Tax=Pseudozyma flocculosa TaxID=84751 RepID=A0A5C3F8D0_9BASI|nr:related to TFB1 - subunit of RNA polymerase II transcription initiation factor TFIIH [Pseudozyma flocculosa]